jgi:hypothetical protein
VNAGHPGFFGPDILLDVDVAVLDMMAVAAAIAVVFRLGR